MSTYLSETNIIKLFPLRHGSIGGDLVVRNWKIEEKLGRPLESDYNWTVLKKHTKETWIFIVTCQRYLNNTRSF